MFRPMSCHLNARSSLKRRSWRLSKAPLCGLLLACLAIRLATATAFVPHSVLMPQSMRTASQLAAKRSKSKSPKPKRAPSSKGFTVTMEPKEDATAKKVKNVKSKAPKQKKVPVQEKVPEPVPKTEEVDAEVVDPNESEEDREFRERYLSADKEIQPDWKQQMDAAKTKEDRFKVGLQVGDFKTSYGILAEELLASFADGDKDRLDDFLTKVGIASWQLALIQLFVIGVPFAGITYVMGLWKFPA
mmetsp:Transcript_68538/g.107885  ORF Transcript_68538/g.107885 Transcript_68538/m.107885 type:complete len:245 (-) Transcript_68538:225-959(-)